MASEQWLLNDTSVASGSYFTAVGSSSYKLKNSYSSTASRTTSSPSPYEGAGCYASSGNYESLAFNNSDNSAITDTGAKYVDLYVYFAANPSSAAHSPVGSGNGVDVEYGSVGVYPNGSVGFISYDGIFGAGSYGTSTAVNYITTGGWMRLQVKVGQKVVEEIKIYKGSNINGTTPDTTLTGTKYSGTKDGMSVGQSPSGDYHWLDNIKFDNTAYPTRGTAYTASGTSTITATGTAAMSNARVGAGSGTGTATGTGAASNQRTLEGSASVTASATAEMSSTQAMSASGTGTASGTADAAVTALVTISGAGGATASATAGASSTQVFAGSATVTATGAADASIRPLVTVDGAGTITATGATTASKQQTLAGTATATASATGNMIFITQITASATVTATATAVALITTPGTLYGSAQKVAGLYGSSTKPTLTTRS